MTLPLSSIKLPHLIQHTPNNRANKLILTRVIIFEAALEGTSDPDGLSPSKLVGFGMGREVAVPSTPAKVVLAS
jgi:hypothetical protein